MTRRRQQDQGNQKQLVFPSSEMQESEMTRFSDRTRKGARGPRVPHLVMDQSRGLQDRDAKTTARKGQTFFRAAPLPLHPPPPLRPFVSATAIYGL